MPMYDYQCDQCGYRFEARQSFHDDPLTECPKCSGAIHRVIHSAGIIFKGSGWFVTDNRKSEPATSDVSSASSESAPAAADE